MPPRWALALYNALGPALFLVCVPFFLPRIFRRGGFRFGAGERFGLYSRLARSQLTGAGTLWIHAVSVGEVAIAARLIGALRRHDPERRIVLSATSTTGLAFARRRLPGVPVFFAPIDFRFAVRRALDLVAPSHLVLVEEEVWPNLVVEAKRRGVTVSVVDARVSRRSELFLRRLLGTFFRGVFGALDAVGVPDAFEAARWRGLGARPPAVVVTGRVKFDDEGVPAASPDGPREVMRRAGLRGDRAVLLAGSTHRGEEALLGRVYLRLRAVLPGLALVVVPRHAERGRSVRRRLVQMGLRAVLRSEIVERDVVENDCVVVDTTGELRDWYEVATVVFVGKSLSRSGGQNPMEPVAAGKPVLFGPRMENFATVARELLEAGGAVETPDEDSLQAAAGRLLGDPRARAEMAANARAVLDRYRGAARRTVDLLLRPALSDG